MPTLQKQIDAIKARYQPQIEALKQRGEALREKCGKPDDIEAMIGVDFTLTMARTEMSFDIPSVTAREHHVALDIPEVISERQEIVFHTPSVRMVRKVMGRYPEFRWPNVEWKEIIVEIPEVFMQEQRIIFDTPSVVMKNQDWYLKIPEFTMERVDWSFDIPQITVHNVKGQIRWAEDEGRKLKAEGEGIANAMRGDIATVIGGAQANTMSETQKISLEAAGSYDVAIARMQAAVDELVAKGVDPIKVPTPAGNVNLRQQLADLVAARAKALAAVPGTPTG